MKFSAPWSYESHPFSPSTPLTTSMVIPLWRKNFSDKGSPSVRTTMPSWPFPIPQALQAAADRLSPEIIRNRLEYWTLVIGPKFSERERKAMKLRRFYSIQHIEFCRNFVFKRNFPIHNIFEPSCDMRLWEMTAHKI